MKQTTSINKHIMMEAKTYTYARKAVKSEKSEQMIQILFR